MDLSITFVPVLRGKVNIRPLLLVILSLWVIIPHNWGHDHDHYYFEKEELHCPLHITAEVIADGAAVPAHAHWKEHEAHCHWCDYVPSFIGVQASEQVLDLISGEPVQFCSREWTLPAAFPVEAKGRGPPAIIA